MTNRKTDTNGWIEIINNPITKVGVFKYRGESINHPDAESGVIYNVLKPEEELSNHETLDSARLLPFINDHPPALLGNPDEGNVSPEDKGICGVIGEQVSYKDGIVFANLKVISDSLAKEINEGKRELSMGQRCEFAREDGIHNGIPYQFKQVNIRFNHIALVDKGRCGKDIAVLDGAVFDGAEVVNVEKNQNDKRQGRDDLNSNTNTAILKTTGGIIMDELEKKIAETLTGKVSDEVLKKVIGIAKDAAEEAEKGKSEDEEKPESEKEDDGKTKDESQKDKESEDEKGTAMKHTPI